MINVKKAANNQIAIKKDIQVLRSEFKSTKKSLFGQMLKLEGQVERVEGKLSGKINGLETKFDKMMTKLGKMDNTLVSFVGRVDNLETENEIGTEHARELRVEVDGHEKRIARLESPTAT